MTDTRTEAEILTSVNELLDPPPSSRSAIVCIAVFSVPSLAYVAARLFGWVTL